MAIKLKQFLIELFGFNLFNEWEPVQYDGAWVQMKHKVTGETMDCIRGAAMRRCSTITPPRWHSQTGVGRISRAFRSPDQTSPFLHTATAQKLR